MVPGQVSRIQILMSTWIVVYANNISRIFVCLRLKILSPDFCIHIHTHTHTHIRIRFRFYLSPWISSCTHTDVYKSIHTYIHTCFPGIIYHPKFNPAPKDLEPWLQVRDDDKIEVVERRWDMYVCVWMCQHVFEPWLQVWVDDSPGVVERRGDMCCVRVHVHTYTNMRMCDV